MIFEIDPIVGNWYCNLGKGQRFKIIAQDENTGTIELQYFDGTIEECDLDQWHQMNLETCAAPLSWAGAEDIDNIDDYGTEVSDTHGSDWNEPADDFAPMHSKRK